MTSLAKPLPGGRRWALLLAVLAWSAGTLAAQVAPDARPKLPLARTLGSLETVATFSGPMPTGVTVSHQGRIFVNFPRWGDPVEYTVAEVKDGQTVPYPDEKWNRANPEHLNEALISVQSVVVDPADRLWILDTGSIKFGPNRPGGPKLVGVNLKENNVFRVITFPREVVHETTYLNDVRFDLRRGSGGLAFITDSTDKGPNGLIVVDLATGKSWRRLNDHPSTKAVPGFLPFVEGQMLMNRPAQGEPGPLKIGSDGIAISANGKRLFYCPLASRRLYGVSVDALADEKATEEAVAKTVEDLGEKPASDGLETDAEGRLYATAYEHNAIVRRLPDGKYETLVHDPRALWPDTLSLATNGFLYFTANQLHRQPQFHNGEDQREKPYALFRVHVGAKPVLLR